MSKNSNKKTTATKKVKKDSEKKTKKGHATKFKFWCLKEGITQVQIRDETKLSIGCIHATWNEGKATDSTIKLISLVYNLDEQKLKNMINTFEKNSGKMNNPVKEKEGEGEAVSDSAN